jgi:hypothetical protein
VPTLLRFSGHRLVSRINHCSLIFYGLFSWEQLKSGPIFYFQIFVDSLSKVHM